MREWCDRCWEEGMVCWVREWRNKCWERECVVRGWPEQACGRRRLHCIEIFLDEFCERFCERFCEMCAESDVRCV